MSAAKRHRQFTLSSLSSSSSVELNSHRGNCPAFSLGITLDAEQILSETEKKAHTTRDCNVSCTLHNSFSVFRLNINENVTCKQCAASFHLPGHSGREKKVHNIIYDLAKKSATFFKRSETGRSISFAFRTQQFRISHLIWSELVDSVLPSCFIFVELVVMSPIFVYRFVPRIPVFFSR